MNHARQRNRPARVAGTAALAAALLVAASAAATEADDAALAACRGNAEIAAQPQAAELGCVCALRTMAVLTEAEKRTVADSGFEVDAFRALDGAHPGLLQAVRGCFAPYDPD